MKETTPDQKEATVLRRTIADRRLKAYEDEDLSPTARRGYCIETPLEVLRTLAKNYYIVKYKDVRNPFGEDLKQEGLIIDAAKNPQGCTIIGPLESLIDFLDTHSERGTSPRRNKRANLSDLRQAFNARVTKEYGPKNDSEGALYQNLCEWLLDDASFWQELERQTEHFDLDSKDRVLRKKLLVIFAQAKRDNCVLETQNNDMRYDCVLKARSRFLGTEAIRGRVYRLARKNCMNKEVPKDILDSLIKSAVEKISQRKDFPIGYLEILGVVNGITNPTFCDVREIALRRQVQNSSLPSLMKRRTI